MSRAPVSGRLPSLFPLRRPVFFRSTVAVFHERSRMHSSEEGHSTSADIVDRLAAMEEELHRLHRVAHGHLPAYTIR